MNENTVVTFVDDDTLTPEEKEALDDGTEKPC